MRRSLVRTAVLIVLALDRPTLLLAQTPPPPPRAAVWQADVPGGDPALARDLARLVKAAGYSIESLNSIALTNRALVHTNRLDLLVIPHARILPIESVGAIEHFLKQGGDLLACGLTAWETPTFRLGGRWLSRGEYDLALAAQRPSRLLLNFQDEDVTLWTRHTNKPEIHTRRERVSERVPVAGVGSPGDNPAKPAHPTRGRPTRAALHVVVDELAGWDTLEPPGRSWLIEPGQSLTCFWAKGTQATRQLAVEWIENDGSRWIATVDLKPVWQYYALPSEAFRPWQPPANRGGPADRLRLNQVARFTVGLALTHTSVGPGRQEYWFADLGAAPNPFGDALPPLLGNVPRLESLSPAYQCYPISTPATVVARQNQFIAPGALTPVQKPTAFPRGTGYRGLHPRPRGCGFDQGRDWRWQPFAQAWTDWALKRHGSLPAAEQAWRVPAPSALPKSEVQSPRSEVMSVPPMSQLTHDGPWRRLVADYRLFLDDLIGAKYAEARRLVRSVDPYHPVSFRMQHAGDPTLNVEHLLPYDFHGLRHAVDLWEPEGYGRIGDWNQVRAGRFTAAYARLCDPAKPLLWAEVGYNVWDARAAAPGMPPLEFAARFYQDFYRMLRESGADGVFFWWYPGGYRLNENSDFGIINPDGTDRSVTQAIRTEGHLFVAAAKPASPDLRIAIDRERDARGLVGLYEAVQGEYWLAVESGREVGLLWEREPGSR